MTRREHYVKAEEILAAVEKSLDSDYPARSEVLELMVARAQVHATLAGVPVSLAVRDS